jgi:hypothetical protein
MNERIAELIESVFEGRIPETGFEYEGAEVTKEDLEKFAETLIHEAIAVVNKRYEGTGFNENEDMEVLRCVEDLKKHFGVE